MPSMTADSVLQLRGWLVQLDHADRHTRKEEVSRLCKELLELGRRWPQEELEDQAKVFDRLGKQLPKFTESQQRDIVNTFKPLRDDVLRRMTESTTALNTWLSESAEPEKATPERLVEILHNIDSAPQMAWFKKCSKGEVKVQFIMTLATVIRALQADPRTPLSTRIAKHSSASTLIARIAKSFFVVPQHGNVMKLWHDGRLRLYNNTLSLAGKRAADQFKDDLQVRLVTALRRKAASQVPQGTTKSRPSLEIEMCEWPMNACPLANAFLDFLTQRGGELGNLGRPSLKECPPNSLRPKTLRRLLERLDSFELVEGKPNKDGQVSPPTVRLRWEAVTALAFKALGTKPKASAVAPPPATKTPAATAVVPEPVVTPAPAPAPQVTRPAATTPSPAPAPSPKSVVTAGAPSGATSSTQGPKASAPSAPQRAPSNKATTGQAPVPAWRSRTERKIDWNDVRILQRVIRKGLRAQDQEWIQRWDQYCKRRAISSDLVQGNVPKEAMSAFVQRNMPILQQKEWAKDILYQSEGQSEEMPPDSDTEPPPTAARAAPAWPATGGASTEKAPAAAAAPPKAKSEHAAPPALPAAPPRPTRSRSRDSSSGSDSSRLREEKRRKRKHEKKKKRGYGYGDYFGRGQNELDITQQALMMNQMGMMGMSMMMNPIAMMGMGTPMMPHQMQMMQSAAGMKMKKDDKSKKARVDDKLKKDVRDRNQVVPQSSKPPPPPPPKEAAEWSARKEAMIDAADL
mmetsp:Transcript_6093/g.11228  ORF Transcript_6093/g.11228 Transcript_6093/m.11228 type:complete len:744 (-) Transcript_6093:115-2346(-)